LLRFTAATGVVYLGESNANLPSTVGIWLAMGYLLPLASSRSLQLQVLLQITSHRLVLAAVSPFLTLWFGFVPGGYSSIQSTW
jgi:hypothetical protein